MANSESVIQEQLDLLEMIVHETNYFMPYNAYSYNIAAVEMNERLGRIQHTANIAILKCKSQLLTDAFPGL